MVVISSAKLTKEVLKTQDLAFCSRPSLLGQQKLSYNGQDIGFAPYNDYWREIQKICVVHLFSLMKVQHFNPIRIDEVSKLINKISEQASASQVTNLSNIVISLTSTIICRVAFGIRFDDEAHEKRRFDEILAVTQEMSAGFFFSDYFPLCGWLDKLFGNISKLEKNFKDLDEFYEELIEQHLNPNRPNTMEGDIIDILLQLRKEKSTPIDLTLDNIKAILMDVFVAGTDTSAITLFCVPLFSWTDRFERNFKDLDEFYEDLIEQHKNPNRPKSMEGDIVDLLLQLKKEQSTPIDITLEDIKGLLMNVLVAGSDTSAAAVVWAMTALIKNPKVMKKVQEEIRNSIGSKGIVKEDDVKNMPYFKAMIKEALRLYPPVPLLVPRESMGNSTLEGYEIQARTILQVNSWAIARDAEMWENPEEFIPERFLNSDIDFKGQHYELIPFGAGRRGCPGIALGIASAELALSNLLYAFDWELPHGMKKEDVDTNVRTGITMHKKNELCLIAKNYF
ncbi:putative cytochrome 83B1-like [Capsicum annuum]|nr:putative cytochrome 83B1-like [Capsicum annuum]